MAFKWCRGLVTVNEASNKKYFEKKLGFSIGCEKSLISAKNYEIGRNALVARDSEIIESRLLAVEYDFKRSEW